MQKLCFNWINGKKLKILGNFKGNFLLHGFLQLFLPISHSFDVQFQCFKLMTPKFWGEESKISDKTSLTTWLSQFSRVLDNFLGNSKNFNEVVKEFFLRWMFIRPTMAGHLKECKNLLVPPFLVFSLTDSNGQKTKFPLNRPLKLTIQQPNSQFTWINRVETNNTSKVQK